MRARIQEEGLDASRAFGAALERVLAKLRELLPVEEAAPRPILISGMASSSIGWRELPYACLPFPLDGSGARWQEIERVGEHRVFVFSGLAAESDVLRGEETEVLGLAAGGALAPFREQALLVLPGTHSKHVRIEAGSITGFSTYMTGELFEVHGLET